MKYLILLAYDGTRYQGWQEQPHQSTVVDTLKNTFLETFGTPAFLYGASRTDSGVHALGQVAEVTSSFEIDPETLKRAWNGRLPQDIHIRKAVITPNEFNPRSCVREKTYYYHFFTQRALPHWARYGTVYWQALDFDKLKEALTLFEGTHDFRSFCTGDEQENTIRTINAIKLIYLKNFKTYRIVFQGPGFLRYMIRRIVGACMASAMRQEISLELLSKTLVSCDPHHTLPTAPAHGLVLRKIEYIQSPWKENDTHI